MFSQSRFLTSLDSSPCRPVCHGAPARRPSARCQVESIQVTRRVPSQVKRPTFRVTHALCGSFSLRDEGGHPAQIREQNSQRGEAEGRRGNVRSIIDVQCSPLLSVIDLPMAGVAHIDTLVRTPAKLRRREDKSPSVSIILARWIRAKGHIPRLTRPHAVEVEKAT